MAVPFNSVEEDSSTDELMRLCYQLIQELYAVLREILRQQSASAPSPAPRSRMPSCEEEAEEDDEHHEPPSSALGQTTRLPELPDVVPRPAPRLRTGTAIPDRRRGPSVFRKYLTGCEVDAAGSVSALATSSTTACFALPSDPPHGTPSPASRQPSPGPRPLPRRKRRPHKPSAVTWEEDDLQKSLLHKMAVLPGPWPGPWVRVGEDLRHIADDFSGNLRPVDEVDAVSEKSLLSLVLPKPGKGTFWTTVVLLVGWRLLVRMR